MFIFMSSIDHIKAKWHLIGSGKKITLTGQWCSHKEMWAANSPAWQSTRIFVHMIGKRWWFQCRLHFATEDQPATCSYQKKKTVLKMIISFSASDFNINPCDLRSILTVHYKCKLRSQWPVLELPSPPLSFWTHSPAVLQSSQAHCQPKELWLGTGDQGLMSFSLNSYEVL